MNSSVKQITLAIINRSTARLHNLGLNISAEELQVMYDEIGTAWAGEYNDSEMADYEETPEEYAARIEDGRRVYEAHQQEIQYEKHKKWALNMATEARRMSVKIGNTDVGPGHPCYIIAEIGINHNGSVETALQLVAAAKAAGCNAVKFQKRTVDVVYTAEELARPRESVYGHTNGDLKRGLEFGLDEYTSIDEYCQAAGIDWFASCWDAASIEFMYPFDMPCIKVASASLTDDDLLLNLCYREKPVILSTGMSTLEQIDHAVDVLGADNLILLHCVSTYPAYNNELNLRAIQTLKDRYHVPVGYSGHELGIASTVAAVALGACVVERHITLDRTMWGSDQSASLEPDELKELVRDIRFVESALGDGVKRVMEREVPVMEKLRRATA